MTTMHPDFQQIMIEATRLTRSGELSAASALLQKALGGADGTGVNAGAQPLPHVFDQKSWAPVIDVSARVIETPYTPDGFKSPISEPSTEEGRFTRGSYSHKSGQRDYKLFVPPMAGDRPLPLVVMLHGCTQNADDFARGTAMNEIAQREGFVALYPEQSQKMNPQGCWNWFKHTHQQRERGEPAVLAGMTQNIIAKHGIDQSRVYVAGLSAGGAMAAILGETYPDLFAAVGVHSGLAAGAATDLPSAFAAMQGSGNAPHMSGSGVPTIVFHGDADHTVSQVNGEQVIAASIGSKAALSPSPSNSSSSNGNSQSRRSTRRVHTDAAGKVTAEIWTVHGAPHAWSGGNPAGSYTDAGGPDASAEMLRFFLTQTLRTPN